MCRSCPSSANEAGRAQHVQDLADLGSISAPVIGRFRTASAKQQTITFAFSGDEAGQGWGINPDFGGYKLYESMRQKRPDFFIHSGDQIYADGPLAAEVKTDDGKAWRNLVTPEKVLRALRECADPRQKAGTT